MFEHEPLVGTVDMFYVEFQIIQKSKSVAMDSIYRAFREPEVTMETIATNVYRLLHHAIVNELLEWRCERCQGPARIFHRVDEQVNSSIHDQLDFVTRAIYCCQKCSEGVSHETLQLILTGGKWRLAVRVQR